MNINNPIFPGGITAIDGNIFQVVIVPLPGWDMDTNDSCNIDISAYDLSLENIIFVSGSIRTDLGDLHYPIPYWNGATSNMALWIQGINNNLIVLKRLDGGAFDGVSFDDDGISRGYVSLGVIL